MKAYLSHHGRTPPALPIASKCPSLCSLPVATIQPDWTTSIILHIIKTKPFVLIGKNAVMRRVKIGHKLVWMNIFQKPEAQRR